MAATYYLLLTEYGQDQIAALLAGEQLQLTHVAIGDANGHPYLPDTRLDQIALVNERARIPVQSVTATGAITTVISTIESDIGGFNIHELAILDSTGKAVYFGNYHGQYKPVLTEGAGGEIELHLDLATSSIGPVFLEIDPNVVTANKQWVLDHFVLLTTYNAHVAQNTLEHNNILDLISAEALARANAVTEAKDEAHAADTALAEGMQVLLDAEATARFNGDQALQNKIGAVGAIDLQTQINNLTGTVDGLYPKVLASGNSHTSYSAGGTGVENINYAYASTGWTLTITSPSILGTVTPQVLITPPSGVDLSDLSKYSVFAHGQASQIRVVSTGAIYKVNIIFEATAGGLLITLPVPDGETVDTYDFYSSWHVIQIKP